MVTHSSEYSATNTGLPAAPIVPMSGCFVAHRDKDTLGVVVAHGEGDASTHILVQWGNSKEPEWHPVGDLSSGFRPGHVVQDGPTSNTRRTLGTGTVRSTRCLAGRDMVLVQLRDTGESRWLPYQHLVRIKDAQLKYERSEAPESDSNERFRLKALAHALDSWNQVTGALDRLDVDPLPHQIDLVHRIMTSDQSNWLIADDVGLGKTIEVGLLLAAMKRRRQGRRVLVVCPAGIVRQWQDEMKYKFNEDFRIYGSDFNINQPAHWSSFDKVIVSIDRAKTDRHGPIFGDSGNWDVIVFDEAHHLSKTEGYTAQRYRLAERLRALTDTFIFLTGTPHQGKTDQFINILLLLRPDLTRRLATMFTQPSVVAEMVLRNRKSLVTDATGEFIFRGQETYLREVSLSTPALEFSRLLREYLLYGYAASEARGDTGRAIGFVMTTYRKLASSSIAAIELALHRRIARLQGASSAVARQGTLDTLQEFTEAFREGSDGFDNLEVVSDEVAATATGANPFFDNELNQIGRLIEVARTVRNNDQKLLQFLSEIVDPLYRQGERLLIFTEYRATQDYLVQALNDKYSNCGIAQINGSMSLNEKRQNIDAFNSEARFMVSTEAGGEGINLHQGCHILLNYDLPWNPRRLVQRAGRLYRYGQQERVLVFNLMANDGFDNMALGMMLQRIYNIAQDMAHVGPEFDGGGLQTEIIGDLLERVDVATILADNKTMNLEHTKEEIEEAIVRAKEARSQQERLFSQIEGYDPEKATSLYTFGPGDILSFLEGILPYRGVRVRSRLFDGRVLELELPEEMRGRFSEFPERATFVRVTVDRRLATQNSRLVQMDFASPFFLELIEFAKSPEFKGEYAYLANSNAGTVALYKVRWQNDQGVPQWEDLIPAYLPDGSRVAHVDSALLGSLLAEPSECRSLSHSADVSERQEKLALLNACAQRELANRCTQLRHPNDCFLISAADLDP